MLKHSTYTNAANACNAHVRCATIKHVHYSNTEVVMSAAEQQMYIVLDYMRREEEYIKEEGGDESSTEVLAYLQQVRERLEAGKAMLTDAECEAVARGYYMATVGTGTCGDTDMTEWLEMSLKQAAA